MVNISREREERRERILEGVSQGRKISEIAFELGVRKRIIRNDIRYMRKIGDPELKKARMASEIIQRKEPTITSINSERFQNMTGMTFQEKSFRNMVDFNKNALMKIFKSKDQHVAIMNLPKSIRKTLKNNGIITDDWHKCEITEKTLEYLFM